jgi:hypothetical protein
MSMVAIRGDSQFGGNLKCTGDNILNSDSIETFMKSGSGKNAEKSTTTPVSQDTHVYYRSPAVIDRSTNNVRHSQLTGMISAKSSTVGVWTDPTSAVSTSGTTGGDRSFR